MVMTLLDLLLIIETDSIGLLPRNAICSNHGSQASTTRAMANKAEPFAVYDRPETL
jgi:hypothetical protein